jgi:hypothetical protein
MRSLAITTLTILFLVIVLVEGRDKENVKRKHEDRYGNLLEHICRKEVLTCDFDNDRPARLLEGVCPNVGDIHIREDSRRKEDRSANGDQDRPGQPQQRQREDRRRKDPCDGEQEKDVSIFNDR